MKKLLKKKVNVFGKGIPVFAIVILGLALVSAALVPYLSNTITGNITVDSPIEIKFSGGSEGVDITSDGYGYSVSLYGGESYEIETTLMNHVEGITGYIAESKIANFDGEGITMTYYDPVTAGLLITGCGSGGDWYYYVGDSTFPLPAVELTSTITVNTAINLEPRTYIGESRIIAVDQRVCTP